MPITSWETFKLNFQGNFIGTTFKFPSKLSGNNVEINGNEGKFLIGILDLDFDWVIMDSQTPHGRKLG
jgi:hypothetical protein